MINRGAPGSLVGSHGHGHETARLHTTSNRDPAPTGRPASPQEAALGVRCRPRAARLTHPLTRALADRCCCAATGGRRRAAGWRRHRDPAQRLAQRSQWRSRQRWVRRTPAAGDRPRSDAPGGPRACSVRGRGHSPRLAGERNAFVADRTCPALARGSDTIVHQAAHRPKLPVRGVRPLFDIRIVNAAAPELSAAARLLREPASPRRIAFAERLITDGCCRSTDTICASCLRNWPACGISERHQASAEARTPGAGLRSAWALNAANVLLPRA